MHIYALEEGPTFQPVRSEVQQMIAKQVWKEIDVGSLIIRLSLFLKQKFLPDGQFGKLKARLVAGGDQMYRSLDGDVSLPAVSLGYVFISAVLALHRKGGIYRPWISVAYF